MEKRKLGQTDLDVSEICLGFFYLGVHNSKKIKKIKRDNIAEKIQWFR